MIKAREINKDKELLNQFLYSKTLNQEMLQLMLNVFNFSPENKDEIINEDDIYLRNPPKDCDINSDGQSLLNKKRKSQDSITIREDTRNSNKKRNFITQTKTDDKTLKPIIEDLSPLGIEQAKDFSNVSYRLDGYKKAFKVNCFQYLTNTLNELLPKELIGKKKFYKPNHESFTANVTEEDNLYFLSMSLKEVYTYIEIDKDKKAKGTKKKDKNADLIEIIFNYKSKSYDDSQNLEKLKQYLDMTVEKSIELYYQSESFKVFSSGEKIKFFDCKFIKEKGFSMLEKNGFIKLIKLYQNKNEDFSNGLSSIHPKMNGINSV
jgi:hypothetical protein